MKILIISALILLSACTSVPVKVPFPAAEEKLMMSPKPLNPIKLEDRDHVALSEMMNIVTINYNNCKENTVKYEAWKTWYKMSKEEYEKANVVK